MAIQRSATLSFADRLAVAIEATNLRWERREGFLSDDNLLDAADDYTVDEPWADDEDGLRHRPDYEALVAALDKWFCESR